MPPSIPHFPDPELRGLTPTDVFGIRNHLANHWAYWLASASPLVEPLPLDELYSAGNLAIAETFADADPALTPEQLKVHLYHRIRHAILAVWHEEYARQHPPFAAVDVERITARRVRYAA